MPVEGPSELVENAQEEEPDNPDTVSEEPGEQQQQRQKEQVKKILANVRQNFGKINVAPEFSEEDLVPVEMPELDMSDISGSDNEEDSDEEEDGKEDGEEDETNVELADGETEVSEPTTAQTGKTNSNKSSREVIRELDEKIAKYKQFLDRAKSKHFSAIRSVCSRPDLTYIFSFSLVAFIQWSNMKLPDRDAVHFRWSVLPAFKPLRTEDWQSSVLLVACFHNICTCSLNCIHPQSQTRDLYLHWA